MSNNWTASTTTEWISFCDNWENPCKSITGEAGNTIPIYVKKATSPDDEEYGTISILFNGEVITKTIKRCIPKIVKTEKTLSAQVSGQFSPCEVLSGQFEGHGVTITNIVINTVITLDDGSTSSTQTSLSLSDVNITYKVNGDVYSYLPSNKGMKRSITLIITPKNDGSVKPYETSVFQEGLKDTNGEWNMDYIVDSGPSGEATYESLNFGIDSSCKNQEVRCDNCEDGCTFNFKVRSDGKIVEEYGSTSGLTVCNETVTLGASTTKDLPIPSDSVTYSVAEADIQTYFVGNTLHYRATERNMPPRVLNITATLTYNGETLATDSTTFTITSANCGSYIYLHLIRVKGQGEEDYIPYVGGETTIRYWLSDVESDTGGNVITDFEIGIPPINGLTFSSPQEVSSGIFERKVTFGRGGDEGIPWTISATCQQAVVSPKELNIYQAGKYENIIPNCDYFMFRYIWNDSDGRDLDSLTHITNCPMLLDRMGRNVSADTVGYFSSTPFDKDVIGRDNKLYLKFGGDNKCNGSEYTIICMKNILKAIEQVHGTDEIWVDVYANWYGAKKAGNLSIEYTQYKSKPNSSGEFNDDIVITEMTDCSRGPYSSFTNNTDYCEKMESVRVDGLSAKAEGTSENPRMAENTDCIDKAYSHVFRLIYKIFGDDGNGITTYYTGFTDNGFEQSKTETYVLINGNMKKITSDYKYEVSRDGGHITFSNFYYKYKPNQTPPTTDSEINIYPFANNRDRFTFDEDKGNTDASHKRAYVSKSDIGNSFNLSYIHNLTLTNGSNGAINIDFDIDAYNGTYRELWIYFIPTRDIFGCGDVQLTMEVLKIFQG